jgi:hypothetical protein
MLKGRGAPPSPIEKRIHERRWTPPSQEHRFGVPPGAEHAHKQVGKEDGGALSGAGWKVGERQHRAGVPAGMKEIGERGGPGVAAPGSRCLLSRDLHPVTCRPFVPLYRITAGIEY